jgi:hypothetical protein
MFIPSRSRTLSNIIGFIHTCSDGNSQLSRGGRYGLTD